MSVAADFYRAFVGIFIAVKDTFSERFLVLSPIGSEFFDAGFWGHLGPRVFT